MQSLHPSERLVEISKQIYDFDDRLLGNIYAFRSHDLKNMAPVMVIALAMAYCSGLSNVARRD